MNLFLLTKHTPAEDTVHFIILLAIATIAFNNND